MHALGGCSEMSASVAIGWTAKCKLLDVGLTLSLGTGTVEELAWWFRDCGWLTGEGLRRELGCWRVGRQGAQVSLTGMLRELQGFQGFGLEG